MNKSRIKAGCSKLALFHGGQYSPTYSVMSILIFLKNQGARIAPKDVYYLPLQAALTELNGVYTTTDMSYLSKKDLRDWDSVKKFVADLIEWVNAAHEEEMRKFSQNHMNTSIIWEKKDAPWFIHYVSLSADKFIYISDIDGKYSDYDYSALFRNTVVIEEYFTNLYHIKTGSYFR